MKTFAVILTFLIFIPGAFAAELKSAKKAKPVAKVGTAKMKSTIRKADEDLLKSLDRANEACESDIAVSVNYADAAKLVVKDADPVRLINIAGSNCGTVLYHMRSLCSDEDYKAAIQEIKKIQCNSKAGLKNKLEMEVKGGVMTVHYDSVQSPGDAYDTIKQNL